MKQEDIRVKRTHMRVILKHTLDMFSRHAELDKELHILRYDVKNKLEAAYEGYVQLLDLIEAKKKWESK